MHVKRPPPWAALLALGALAAACDDTVSGVKPVGGDVPSDAEIERFARRLHLDLTGTTPSEAFLADAVARVTAAGNTAEVRRELADELIAGEAFAELWVAELENRAFGGETAEARYALLCGIIRTDDPACNACSPPADGDPCGGCACAALDALYDERAALASAAEDLAAGDLTSSLDRRFAATTPFRVLSAPDAVAAALFEGFLGYAPQAEQREAAAAMVTGALLPGSPAGLLFHRHGADYDDLLEIVFGSEIYREAIVGAVFERYLGRRPSAPELGHFAASLAAGDPDARAVIAAVVSSREYFDQ